MKKLKVYKYTLLLCIPLALLLSACGVIDDDKNVETVVIQAPTAKPTESMPTPSPTPEPTPTPTPEPTPTPSPTPEPTAYQSEEYPLAAKSLRTHEGGRYAEEEKLNDDPTLFRAVVDLTNQVVFVYKADENGKYTVLVREMICSSGIEETNRSPRGTFTMGEDYKRFAYFVNFGCYAQYWSQIRGSIYFHSVPYSERDDRYLMEEEFWKLGEPASHGCIRLLPDDAHWIYLYLCPGSTVIITDEYERDEELRARLLPKETPTPDCYMIEGQD
jgi:lipoprotein-anchoring transpeptidase ErfK/SrfK